MNRIVFCPECRQDVKFSVREKPDSAELKGEAYEFTSKTAYCNECGTEVYVPEIEDENLKALYDAYRQKHGIISLEDIRAIPEKYNIGKRPLSLLLGWGEQTFSRYYDGDMPAKQYSEKLKQVLADPAYYLSLLERGKDNLKSEKAYEKSKAATGVLLNLPISEKRIPCVGLGSKQYRYHLDEVIKALDVTTVHEKANVYESAGSKKYSYQDYLELPEEPGYRFEILEGFLVREPSPNVMHQRVSRRMQWILEDYFRQTDPDGELFNAPLDVTMLDSVVQPDLFFISGAQKELVLEARIDGPPKLVVEILSPSTIRKDRLKKLKIYQEAQVEHYWLVNPDEKTMECFALRADLYSLVASGMDEDIVEHPDFPALSIHLATLWYGLPSLQ